MLKLYRFVVYTRQVYGEGLCVYVCILWVFCVFCVFKEPKSATVEVHFNCIWNCLPSPTPPTHYIDTLSTFSISLLIFSSKKNTRYQIKYIHQKTRTSERQYSQKCQLKSEISKQICFIIWLFVKGNCLKWLWIRHKPNLNVSLLHVKLFL